MLYREIIAVYSEIHTKHINTAVWAERGTVSDSLSKLAHFHPLMQIPKVEQLKQLMKTNADPLPAYVIFI